VSSWNALVPKISQRSALCHLVNEHNAGRDKKIKYGKVHDNFPCHLPGNRSGESQVHEGDANLDKGDFPHPEWLCHESKMRKLGHSLGSQVYAMKSIATNVYIGNANSSTSNRKELHLTISYHFRTKRFIDTNHSKRNKIVIPPQFPHWSKSCI
jgi:hypothetical protein